MRSSSPPSTSMRRYLKPGTRPRKAAGAAACMVCACGRSCADEQGTADVVPFVEKNYGDAFEDTTLENVLSGLGVGRLVVVGAQTDACIRSTLHGAFARGYDATLVSDAHTTEDQTAWGAPPPEQVIAHTNLYWTYQTAPGRTAGTVEAKDVDFGTS